MEKYKVLIIEDNPEDYIKIQENLIPDGGVSRLPYDFDINTDKDKRRRYIRELNTDLDDKIKPEDCLSEEEQALTTLLRPKGGLKEAESMIDRIIKENYNDLRLVICDLKLCEDNEAGKEIIRHLREDRILDDTPWFLKNIPIIILTGVDGVAVGASERGGINSRVFKKIDVLYNMRGKSVSDDTNNLDSCQSLFRSIVDMLATNFDDQYNKHLTKYKVALSFTNVNDLEDCIIPHREFVEMFVHCLYPYFTREKVYYYEDKPDNNNLGKDLEEIYKEKSEFVIVFISDDYNTHDKSTTQTEWKAIKEKYESRGWKGVVFVPIENSVANRTSIGRILNIENFSEIPIDFSDLREKFYNVYNGVLKSEDDRKKIIDSYNSVCKDTQKRIFEKIINGKMKMGVFF